MKNNFKSKLYIVEGVPCTGKTSISEFVANVISENGGEVLHFPEGKPNHPADYSFHAYVTNEEFKKFKANEKEMILSNSVQKLNGYVISLENINGELFDKLINHKIYDMLPWETENHVMLEKWSEFSELAENDNNIYVFDCCFLQNPLCETMMRFNMDYEKINDYVSSIYERIKNLNPVLIYLKNTNIKERIEGVSKERDKKWLQDVIEYHTSQGYGKEHNLEGFDGYVECLKERQKVELSILGNLDIDKLIIENPFEDYNKSHKEIKDFITKNC